MWRGEKSTPQKERLPRQTASRLRFHDSSFLAEFRFFSFFFPNLKITQNRQTKKVVFVVLKSLKIAFLAFVRKFLLLMLRARKLPSSVQKVKRWKNLWNIFHQYSTLELRRLRAVTFPSRVRRLNDFQKFYKLSKEISVPFPRSLTYQMILTGLSKSRRVVRESSVCGERWEWRTFFFFVIY